ncbi:MAG: AAA family ATPase [Erysipelotrichaceae bacterium]
MRYLTCADVAKQTGNSVRRVQQMCKEGSMPGAVKSGKIWLIQEDSIVDSYNTRKRLLPVGVSDFKTAVSNYYYVDKTLLIRDFLDRRPAVSLFTRPRRFGKTLNMDMLRVFFEKTGEDTSVYFRDKKIWECGDYYTCHQGQYPVIFLSFKDIKCLSWEETFEKIREIISLEFDRHNDLGTSDILNEYEKERFQRFVKRDVSEVECQMSLQFLSLMLHKHYGEKCIIIIDEYDTPIQQGHSCNFYNDTVNFMRNFFSGGLKDNPHLAFGFLTGILRVAKESIFSGMNNLKTNSILDYDYSEYFGFTEEEVSEMIGYYKCSKKYDEIKRWYDGYKFGNTEIFNPWSVINYISDNCLAQAFWQSTSSNDIIGEIIDAATPEIKKDLFNLLNGQTITTYIDTSVVYPEIQKNPYSIYSFLLVAGYLKVVMAYPQNDGNYMCEIKIPNQEISFVYKKEILNKTNQNSMSVSFGQAIFNNDVIKMQEVLEEYMINSISSLDGVNEAFYHGLMLGLCAVVDGHYKISSNRESGLGRFDIQLTPIISSMPGFIFEFKHAKDEKADLSLLAEKALNQINEKKYDTELKSLGIQAIIKIGIAFRGKEATIKRS